MTEKENFTEKLKKRPKIRNTAGTCVIRSLETRFTAFPDYADRVKKHLNIIPFVLAQIH